MFNFDKFCDRFNELIEGKSQLELSKAMNLSQPVISKLKKHTGQSPSAETIYTIANYFNVSTDWLLGLTDIKSTDTATKDDIYREGYIDGYMEGYTYIVNQIKSIIK